MDPLGPIPAVRPTWPPPDVVPLGRARGCLLLFVLTGLGVMAPFVIAIALIGTMLVTRGNGTPVTGEGVIRADGSACLQVPMLGGWTTVSQWPAGFEYHETGNSTFTTVVDQFGTAVLQVGDRIRFSGRLEPGPIYGDVLCGDSGGLLVIDQFTGEP